MDNLLQLFSSGLTRHYPKGQIVLYQGDKTNSVYYIVEGYLKVYDIDAKGNEKILLILGKGNIFPLLPTTKLSVKFQYFYQALSEIELRVITNKDLKSHLDQEPAAISAMLEYYGALTQDLLARVACIDATDAKHKIAQVMEYLITHHGEKTGNHHVIKVPLTHQTIADMAGVVRETASLHLKDMQDDGIVSINQKGFLRISTGKLHRLIDKASDKTG